MIVDTSTVVAALVAVDFGDRRLGEIRRAGHAICGSRFAVGTTFNLTNRGALSVGFVDVASDLQVEVALGRCSRVGFAFSVGILLALEDNRVSRRLPGLQTARRVADDLEMTSKRRAYRRWALLSVDLIFQSAKCSLRSIPTITLT